MHGVGISRGTTINRPYLVVLDVTRLLSRVGQGPLTGVDRVELAYLNWCLETDGPFYCLARVSGGYVLLDRAGAELFRVKLRGKTPWGRSDFRAMIGLRTASVRSRAESDLRRLAVARSGRTAPPKMSADSGIYLNVGHSNLTETTLTAVVRQGLKPVVLVHDMIPLDFPHFQREGTVGKFRNKMQAVARHADLVIANSAQTQRRVESYFDKWRSSPKSIVAHLGVEQLQCDQANLGNDRPYFVSIGTIEPRKNHAFLLDVWDAIEADLGPEHTPVLHIAGRRGWRNEDVFRRLDALKSKPWLHEHKNMGDAALSTLLAGSHGLLFPTLAEGFGLPSLEAAQMGVPVICGDLAIHRELLGDYPVYADLQDIYLWKKTILQQAAQRQEDLIHAYTAKKPKIPTWSEHFEVVNAAVTRLL